MYNYNITDE
ncbi:hypothetical protein AYI69_g9369, partial [Smittium culicis]